MAWLFHSLCNAAPLSRLGLLQLVRPTVSKYGLARQRSLASNVSVAPPLSRVSYRSDYSVTPNLEALVRRVHTCVVALQGVVGSSLHQLGRSGQMGRHIGAATPPASVPRISSLLAAF